MAAEKQRQVKVPVATSELDARQLNIEDAIIAAAAVEARAPSVPIPKPAKPAGIWRGPMPAVVAVEAKQHGIGAARLAGLWKQARTEKQWIAGQSTTSNVVKSWRRWLAHKVNIPRLTRRSRCKTRSKITAERADEN